jgi:hypothetical protein
MLEEMLERHAKGIRLVTEKTLYIHKHEVSMRRGGPEEGGWYYDEGYPVEGFTPFPMPVDSEYQEEFAYAYCRFLNDLEHHRRKRENRYGYSSVLSYRDTFYSYTLHEDSEPYSFPETRPHYE